MEKEKNYLIKINPYEITKKNESAKKLIFNNKFVGISVGATINMKKGFNPILLIDIHYDSDNQETLTYSLDELEGYTNIVALNPKFKNKELIEELRNLNIISEPIKVVKKGTQNYEMVSVNLDELKLYEPFGDTILNEFKKKEYVNENYLEEK